MNTRGRTTRVSAQIAAASWWKTAGLRPSHTISRPAGRKRNALTTAAAVSESSSTTRRRGSGVPSR